MMRTDQSLAIIAKAALAVGASLTLAAVLLGCGQKGPLVLERPAAQASPASAASTTAR